VVVGDVLFLLLVCRGSSRRKCSIYCVNFIKILEKNHTPR